MMANKPQTSSEPSDVEAERAVLGSCILDQTGEALGRALEKMEPNDLFFEPNRLVLAAMQTLAMAQTPIDAVTLTTELRSTGGLERVGGLPYLVSLASTVPTAANVGHYAAIVKEKSKVRAIRAIAKGILASSEAPGATSDALLSHAQSGVLSLNYTKQSRIQTALEWTLAHDKRLKERDQHKTLPYLECGIDGVDKAGMLRRSAMIVIGGRPASGKSAWAMNIALGVAKRGKHVLIIEIEMPEEMMADRFTAHDANVDTRTLERAYLMTPQQWLDATNALQNLSTLPLDLWVVDQLHIHELVSTVTQYDRIRKLDMLMVDYVQLCKGVQGDGREREISSISWGLTTLAKSLNIPVVALSQLSRKLEERTDKRPILSDLRESGSLEQDATVVQFMYRPASYDGRAYDPIENDVEGIISKFRGGPMGWFPLKLEKPFQRFSDP